MTEIAARLTRPIQRLGALTTLAVCVVAAVVIAATTLAVRAVQLRDAVLPGVSVAGIELGGLSQAEAGAPIGAGLAERLARPVRVAVGGDELAVTPAALFRVDVEATQRAAFREPRRSLRGSLAGLALPGRRIEVEPVLHVRPEGLAALRAAIGAGMRAPASARLEMRGLEPVVLPARRGTAVDEVALLDDVRAAALSGVAAVEAPVVAVEPGITTREAREAADAARLAVSAPVRIRADGKRVGELRPRMLARLVRFRPSAGRYDVVFDRNALAARLEPVLGPHLRKPVDARFRVRGAKVRVVPARPGTTLDPAQAAAAVRAGAVVPSPRVAELELAPVAAAFTTREAKALGIRERISAFTTDMGPSSANRIWNVQLLGRFLDGTILKPGQVFRYNKTLGPRTAERGFREGQMIFGGVLVPSIGGGVCQTATTIFNAAFEAGLPIRERHNHSFYISHYPVGRDATVSWGGPDLVFRNDLDHAILIKAHGDAHTFTVSFYGTKQKRRVVATTSERTNFTQPRLQYAVDPTAPAGSVRTTSGGGPGFDVTVYRKVFEDGKLIRRDKFSTRYVPENPTAIYGPGATPPGPYFVLPSGA